MKEYEITQSFPCSPSTFISIYKDQKTKIHYHELRGDKVTDISEWESVQSRPNDSTTSTLTEKRTVTFLAPLNAPSSLQKVIKKDSSKICESQEISALQDGTYKIHTSYRPDVMTEYFQVESFWTIEPTSHSSSSSLPTTNAKIIVRAQMNMYFVGGIFELFLINSASQSVQQNVDVLSEDVNEEIERRSKMGEAPDEAGLSVLSDERNSLKSSGSDVYYGDKGYTNIEKEKTDLNLVLPLCEESEVRGNLQEILENLQSKLLGELGNIRSIITHNSQKILRLEILTSELNSARNTTHSPVQFTDNNSDTNSEEESDDQRYFSEDEEYYNSISTSISSISLDPPQNHASQTNSPHKILSSLYDCEQNFLRIKRDGLTWEEQMSTQFEGLEALLKYKESEKQNTSESREKSSLLSYVTKYIVIPVAVIGLPLLVYTHWIRKNARK